METILNIVVLQFFCLLFLVFALEVAAIVLGYVYHDKVPIVVNYNLCFPAFSDYCLLMAKNKT